MKKVFKLVRLEMHYHNILSSIPPLGGLEPPAFRLTAERASQLRHRGMFTTLSHDINILSEKNTILSDPGGDLGFILL